MMSKQEDIREEIARSVRVGNDEESWYSALNIADGILGYLNDNTGILNETHTNRVSPKKAKRPTLSSMKEKVWLVFSPYIRLRDCLKTTGSIDWGECISCSETKPYSDLDAGHFVAKRGNNYFSEKGVHAQCQSCNRFKGGTRLSVNITL